ncbi:MAG: radical SAM protein [Nitrospirota bacterium]
MISRNSMTEHPCYSSEASHKFARIHLAVAPRCNIGCKYCVRDFNCVNESRPGVCSEILTSIEALRRAEEVISRDPRVRVIGIAGPGDPLANDETFETLKLIHQKFPHLIKCLSTNGLLLPEKVDTLYESGVRALTVTINSATSSTGSKIYSHINYHGKRYYGLEASTMLLSNQFDGVKEAVKMGMSVKINSIFIPAINEGELLKIAETVKEMGVDLMNIMPLIPLGDFAYLRPPSKIELQNVQELCGKVIKIFKHCQQCRADAVGLITERGSFGKGCVRPCTKISNKEVQNICS